MAKGKGSKRQKAKFPGLEKGLFSRIKQEYFEGDDYSHTLSDEDKAYLAQFNEEFLGANLTTKKNKKYNRKENLHGDEYSKSIYHSNNARNRDLYSRAKGVGKLTFDLAGQYENDSITLTEEEKDYLVRFGGTPSPGAMSEEELIDYIDLKREFEDAELDSSDDHSGDE